ncbi:hypothetical protein HPTD01_1478 [Halomonas sp. TD01]|nr:hypothetical protein HPTD01_1478 [Halomonas sp. TD01]
MNLIPSESSNRTQTLENQMVINQPKRLANGSIWLFARLLY